MTMQAQKTLLFANTQRHFSAVLNKRVHDYFAEQKISRHANSEMVVKTVVMFMMYWVPYGLIVTGVANSWWLLPAVVVMSLGLAGIGLSVMHDANHGAYSQKKWVNVLLGYSLNLVGASSFSWKMQHNVLHHAYTNVIDHDEDISSRGVLRLTPHTELKRFHRFQFLYAWFLYGLMTIVWMVVNDFRRMVRYDSNGLAKKHKANMRREWVILLVTKAVYVGYIFLIPLWFSPLAWWEILAGIMIMHYIAGFILAIIFQPAHVAEGSSFPLPDEDNTLETNWTIHQLLTTINFGNRSRWFSWYVGGLNFQIEHHLFPNICHVHYRHIAGIVKDTAQEYGLPYHSTATFWGALRGHGKLLWELGRANA